MQQFIDGLVRDLWSIWRSEDCLWCLTSVEDEKWDGWSLPWPAECLSGKFYNVQSLRVSMINTLKHRSEWRDPVKPSFWNAKESCHSETWTCRYMFYFATHEQEQQDVSEPVYLFVFKIFQHFHTIKRTLGAKGKQHTFPEKRRIEEMWFVSIKARRVHHGSRFAAARQKLFSGARGPWAARARTRPGTITLGTRHKPPVSTSLIETVLNLAVFVIYDDDAE